MITPRSIDRINKEVVVRNSILERVKAVLGLNKRYNTDIEDEFDAATDSTSTTLPPTTMPPSTSTTNPPTTPGP